MAFPVLFGKIVDILKDLVDIVSFDITTDGFSAITLDGTFLKIATLLTLIILLAAHVFLIELILRTRTAFTKYELRFEGR